MDAVHRGPLVQLRGVVKDYRSLRPLRVKEFDLRAGEVVSIVGLDGAAAEVLVNLITGAILPDTGDVVVIGQKTRDVTHADDWVSLLDQFGLISERAVLLDELTVGQNLAMPLSLTIHSMNATLRAQVDALAAEVGLSRGELDDRLGGVSPLVRARLRLGRALALDPKVLIAEHANAPLSGDDTVAFARDLGRVAVSRGMAALIITADRAFAEAAGSNVQLFEPPPGGLKPLRGWRRWLS